MMIASLCGEPGRLWGLKRSANLLPALRQRPPFHLGRFTSLELHHHLPVLPFHQKSFEVHVLDRSIIGWGHRFVSEYPSLMGRRVVVSALGESELDVGLHQAGPRISKSRLPAG